MDPSGFGSGTLICIYVGARDFDEISFREIGYETIFVFRENEGRVSQFRETAEITKETSFAKLENRENEMKAESPNQTIMRMLGIGLIRNGVFNFSRNTIIASCWM
jgi:hypothetical protein